VTFSDLSTEGKTTIYGGNIDTESLFAKAIASDTVTVKSTTESIPTFTLIGKNSRFYISSPSTSMSGATTLIGANDEIVIAPNACIILQPGSDPGSSGYTGVVIDGDISITGAIRGDQIAGTWTPVFYGATVSSYTRQNGWYTKIGNVVTLGWDMHATISSGSTSTDIQISALPFTPSCSAYGGGEASGYYAPANTIFVGWQASTVGRIYARGQTNGSSAGVRHSTGVCFRESGDVLASGTLTFITAS
jgi:hypothetical protein